MFTDTYWGSQGSGRYQEDYDRLARLVPRDGGRAETVRSCNAIALQ